MWTGCAPHEFQTPLHLSDYSFYFNFPLIQPLLWPQKPTKNPHSLFLYSICSALLLRISKKEGGASLRPHHHTKTLRYMSCFNILNTKYFKIIEKVKVAQSCPALCKPMDCSLPGSSLHGIFQAIVLEWGAISFSRAASRPRDWTQVSCIVDRCFTIWATRASIHILLLLTSMLSHYLLKNICSLSLFIFLITPAVFCPYWHITCLFFSFFEHHTISNCQC